MLGWLANDPKDHDVSGKNITLIGQNFITKNPLLQNLMILQLLVHFSHLQPPQIKLRLLKVM